ncbi:MAG: hypothetical protein K9M82_11445 [Deltaproteobacteria bacterium]|nr:hypothetical protein [Deltaproteobacteria bacterium]
MESNVKIRLCASVFTGSFLFVRNAYAYLDPGSGSMLLQILLGGVAGVAVIGKLYWSRIKEFFQSRFSGKEKR